MTVTFKLSTGEQGQVNGFDGTVLSLVSSRPFAPGQPVTLQLCAGKQVLEIQGKSIGSKRQSDGAFKARIKLINLRRNQRDWLLELFSPDTHS